MSDPPEVSVVMSVYNGAGHLGDTLASILGQHGCDFELVVVDDGSTDATASILAQAQAGDSRVRVLCQANAGLTLALARGCAEARGVLIARQDSGDISLPGRLAAQRDFLAAHPAAAMTACGVQFVGPEAEPLYCIARPMDELDSGLRQTELSRLHGPPHHGGTMFRRELYFAVGGYRLPFTAAQDIDLWLRLSEQGLCLGTAEVLYEARLEAGSISSRRRAEQFSLGALALACAAARREKRGEAATLAAYSAVAGRSGRIGTRELANFHYFVASCLRTRDPAAASRYYRQAVKDNPFHWKALMRCITG